MYFIGNIIKPVSLTKKINNNNNVNQTEAVIKTYLIGERSIWTYLGLNNTDAIYNVSDNQLR